MSKTIDGIKLDYIIKVAEAIGASVRSGAKHPFILGYNGLRPCPIAESTIAKTMVVPWMKIITQKDSGAIYEALRNGEWGY